MKIVVHLDAAHEIAQTQNHAYLLGMVLAEQAVLFACLGEYTRASDTLAMALPVAQQSGNDEALVTIFQELALLAGLEGNSTQVTAYLNAGLTLAQGLNRPEALYGLAQIAAAQADSVIANR